MLHLVKIVKSAKLVKGPPLLLLVSKDKWDLLLKVAHDEVLVAPAVDLKLDVAYAKGYVGQIHQESLGFGCYPEQGGKMLVQKNSHIFDLSLPENVHPHSKHILVGEGLSRGVVGLEQINYQIQPKRWLASFVTNFGAPFGEEAERSAG